MSTGKQEIIMSCESGRAERSTRRGLKWGVVTFVAGLGSYGLAVSACAIICGVPFLAGLGLSAAAISELEAGASIVAVPLIIGGVGSMAFALSRSRRRRAGCEPECCSAMQLPHGRADVANAEPIACTLERAGALTRLEEFRGVFARGLLGGERISGGVRWRFRKMPGFEAELRSLAEREHQCCRFFDFEIHVQGEELWWETRTEPAAEPVLEEFFALPERLATTPTKDLVVSPLFSPLDRDSGGSSRE